MPGTETIAWACVVWLIVGLVVGGWLSERTKPRRRRATPSEVAALRYVCDRNRDLESENIRLRERVSRLGLRVVEIEEEATRLRTALRLESRFYRFWNGTRGRDVAAGAAEGMGV